VSERSSFPCIGVVADDLPGAALAGTRLRIAGHRTVVVSMGQDWPETPEAIVVNVATRERAASGEPTVPSSTDRVRNAVRQMQRDLACQRYELRVDAALRRDYSDELKALIEGTELVDPLVLAVPAYPSAGRLTRDGRQVALVAKGEAHEVEVASVLFRDQSAATISLTVVREGSAAVVEAVLAQAETQRHFVCDATQEDDLRVLADAAAVLERDHDVVTVSSGAWLRFHPAYEARPTFVAMGLPTEPNEEQLRELLLGDRVRLLLTRQAEQLAVDEVEFRRCMQVADTIVVKAEGEATDDRARLRAAGDVAIAVEMLLVLSRRVGAGCRGIVGTGAYTASRLADKLKAGVISPLTEVAPACPVGYLAGGPWTGLPIVMKGGLVGGSSALTEIVNHLQLMPEALSGGGDLSAASPV
jgi:uncharacterized protein YgbK (DUF1537 family)